MLLIVPLADDPRVILSQVLPPSREWTSAALLPPAQTSGPWNLTTENSMPSPAEKPSNQSPELCDFSSVLPVTFQTRWGAPAFSILAAAGTASGRALDRRDG